MMYGQLSSALVAFSWFVLVYFAAVNSTYLVVHAASFVGIARERTENEWNPVYSPDSTPFLPSVAVTVPAYDEQEVIVDNVQSLLNLEYPNHEVVVVNDGSTDDTLERLLDEFDLERVQSPPPFEVSCERVRDVYVSPYLDLTVVDKENGGKSDALNAALEFSESELFCSVDADSVIERAALLEVVKPFLRDPERTVASGGSVRVANGCEIEDGEVESVALSPHPLVRMQTMEYIRAFLAGRVGLSGLNSLLIISGAFGIFRADVLRDVGGYSTETVTEDMEMVVRIHTTLADRGRDYRMKFIPQPVVWTQVPEDVASLSNQRRRWYRGLLETLTMHRYAFGRPRYGAVGVFALPFFFVAEALGPLVEGLGYVSVAAAFLLGVVDLGFMLLFLAVAVGVGAVLSWLSVLAEVVGFRRYQSPWEIATLMVYGLLENVVYRQWKAYVAWRGFVDLLRGGSGWLKAERVRFR